MNKRVIRLSTIERIAREKGLELDSEIEKILELELKAFLSRCIKSSVYYSKSREIQTIHIKAALARRHSSFFIQ